MKPTKLDSAVEVTDGIHLAELWERFEVFEALHHTMVIDNPMTSADLDDVVELLAPRDGEAVLDLACGHGELLRRLRTRSKVVGRGVDLSPWMLNTAYRLSNEPAASPTTADLTWILDDAKDHGIDETFDLATCLGASWVWHGFAGTVRSLAKRTKPNGRIAIGDMHLRDGLDPLDLLESHGRIESIDELEASFGAHGLDIIGRINTTDDAWDDYLERTRQAATSWADLYPGERSDSFVVDQKVWEQDHARDREVLTWSVWVAKAAR